MANILSRLNPFKKKEEAPKAPPSGEISSDSATETMYAGYMDRYYPNPDYVLTANKEGKQIDIYSEMKSKDPKIASCLQTRSLGVASKSWHVEPGSDDEIDAERAQIIQYNILEALDNFTQDLKDGMKCVQDGFAVLELIWDYDEDNNLYCPTQIKGRNPKYFAFEPDTHNLLFKPQDKFEYESVPEYKFLIFRNDPDYENPYGTSALKNIYWYYWFKKLGIKFWAMAIERYGLPLKVLKYPVAQEKDNEQMSHYEQMINDSRTIGSDFLLPDNVAIEILERKLHGGGDQEKFADYIDRLIAQSILGQTLTSDIGKSGSKAAVQGHEEIRQDILESDAINIQVGFNLLIKWVYQFNWGVPKYNYPTLKIEYEPEKDRKTNAEIINSAVNEIRIPIRKEQAYNDLGLEQPTTEDTEDTLIFPHEQPEQLQPDKDKDKDKDKKKFAEAEVEMNRLAVYPPPNLKVYKVGSIATIQESFRKELNSLFDGIADKLPTIFRKSGAEQALFRSLLNDWLRDNYETQLRKIVTKGNRQVLEMAAFDMAEKLETKLSRPMFDMLTKQFLQDHFYEFGTVERITGMKNTMVDDLIKTMERLKTPDMSIDGLVKEMQEHWQGFIAPSKIKQITLTETRSAANWAAIQIAKQNGKDMEAWFWVDPASCSLCQEWAMGNPYTLKQAQEMGLPHPSCNDQWVMTLKSENQ